MRVEPEPGLTDEGAAFAAYLRFYRETILEKCRALPYAEQRRPHVPSGWTPLQLLNHVVHVERRWIVWGFLGEQVADPWGDHLDGVPDGPWVAPQDGTVDGLAAQWEQVAAHTERVLAATPMATSAATGGRFDEDPPDLRWICFHLLQEVVRHAGHLDVAVELAGGPTGE
ncbi:DUF664 domain-containing protein [Nocardioides ferulae]|uniref:mycothiol transferase n=1 Tax=Nocardioides ferulae TaxID=2340821 RepID=UPI000EAFCDE4|nr:DUF664 domain-containing protein [Nocardioides ferulae]